MTRTALIIGLGGTGQWVLTYLKKDLIESNSGRMPPNVKLLAFDTMPQVSHEASSAPFVRGKENSIAAGTVRLETDSEYIHIGGDLYPVGELMVQSDAEAHAELGHIGGWFMSDHWMHALPRVSWVLSDGAGHLRQFGRLGLFKDLSDLEHSKIWNRIDAAAKSLDLNLRWQRLDIIVVGSFAGGTGSGMSIDLGLLLRERFKEFNTLIRGYFLLPRVFDQDPDDDMKARSFAAWRELNRFMTVSPDFPMSAIVYNPKSGRLQIHRISRRVYDACYLIDGRQDGRRIDVEPEKLVFPAVADAISASLDDTAGNAFMEWAVMSLVPEYDNKPGVPLYSTVGAYSFKVPAYYARQEFAHKLAADFLEALLQPIRDDSHYPTRITHLSDALLNARGQFSSDQCLVLFTHDFYFEDKGEQVTLFTQRIAELSQQRGAADLGLVTAYAAGALDVKTGRGRSWLYDFTVLGNRADVRDVTQNIDNMAKLQLTDTVKPSRDIGEHPSEGPKRFARDIPKFYNTFYGGRDESGRDYGGLFGAALEQASQLQVDIFSRNAQLWLVKTLMGNDAESVTTGKSSQIGHAFSLLNGVVHEFSDFLSFLTRVAEERRNRVQPRLKAEDLRNRRLAEMQKANAKTGLFWTSTQSYAIQERYLQAEQLVFDVRKDELLQRAVEDTAKRMQAIAIAMRDELESWIKMLATGDPVAGVEALAQSLEKRWRAIRDTADADKDIAAQTIVASPDYQQGTAELARMMRSVTWKSNWSTGGFRLSLELNLHDEQPIRVERPADQPRADQRIRVAQRTLDSILDYTERRYDQLPVQTNIAQQLAEKYGYDARRFMSDLGDKADPFFARTVYRPGGAAKWSKRICIYNDRSRLDPRTREFVENTQKEMRNFYGVATDLRDQDRLVEAVGSADIHKCTIVHTDDLYDVRLFEAWEECEEAYIRNPHSPPHLNHIFPAEIRAAQLEIELAKHRVMQVRVFHPWVVTLLEHQDRFEQFLICKGLGWIKTDNDKSLNWYAFQLPSDTRSALKLTKPIQGRISWFRVMNSYILFGLDHSVRSAREIDYEAVRRSLLDEEKVLGEEAWLGLLRSQIETLGDGRVVVPWMLSVIDELDGDKEIGQRSNGEPANYRRAYEDLAEVSGLLLEKLIEAKHGPHKV